MCKFQLYVYYWRSEYNVVQYNTTTDYDLSTKTLFTEIKWMIYLTNENLYDSVDKNWTLLAS